MAVQTFTRTLAASVAETYKFFTNEDMLTCWLADGAHTNARVGGHILLTWTDHTFMFGEFTALEENKFIAFTWRETGEASASQVEISIAGDDHSSQVTVRHHNVIDPALAEREWNKALDTLVTVFETGADRRVTDRVILGIFPDEVSKELAEKIGIKPSEGVRIGGLVPNYGAQKAGLLEGDVIVGVAGESLSETNTLQSITSRYRAGDTVEVSYYRDGAKQSAQMPLTGYPIPEFPPTYEGLAEYWAKQNADLSAELDQVFAGVSAAEADHHPAEGEWNAKEVLAHLILNERWLHHWMGTWMQLGFAHGYSCNTPARVKGLTATYPDHQALVAELKRCWAESVALIEHIPAEHRQRPTMQWWFGFELGSMVDHTRRHFEQIRAAVAHARA